MVSEKFKRQCVEECRLEFIRSLLKVVPSDTPIGEIEVATFRAALESGLDTYDGLMNAGHVDTSWLDLRRTETVLIRQCARARRLNDTGNFLPTPYYWRAALKLISMGFLTKVDPLLPDQPRWITLRLTAENIAAVNAANAAAEIRTRAEEAEEELRGRRKIT